MFSPPARTTEGKQMDRLYVEVLNLLKERGWTVDETQPPHEIRFLVPPDNVEERTTFLGAIQYQLLLDVAEGDPPVA